MKDNKYLWVYVLVGVFGLLGLFFVFGVFFGSRIEAVQKHKAVADMPQANNIMGAFIPDDDKQFYVKGVRYLEQHHKQLGRYTIGEVIDGERSREQATADARDAATQRTAEARQKKDEAAAELRQRNAVAAAARRKAASDRAIVADEKQGITAVFDIVRDSNPTVDAAFKDWSVDENGTLQITVDADSWDELSRQDKDRVGRVLAYSWKKVYGHVNHDPDPSVYIQLTDLAGNAVDQYR